MDMTLKKIMSKNASLSDSNVDFGFRKSVFENYLADYVLDMWTNRQIQKRSLHKPMRPGYSSVQF